jgi:hypothetical protein
MMRLPGSAALGRLLSCSLLACLAAGCSDKIGQTLPVRGKITFNNAPLTEKSTRILFKPDRSRDNQTPFEPVGTVDDSGNYTVSTKGKSGAPPGWYKVVVSALRSAPEHAKGPQAKRPVAESLLPAKYGIDQNTPLQIEVTEDPAPGAYDLKLFP